MEIIVVRHALPRRVETSDGSPADPPLSELGRRQADALAQWLAVEQIDAVYSSPLLRARQTAAPLAERLATELRISDGLAEFDRHEQSYVPMEELRETDYATWREVMANGGMPPSADPRAFQSEVVAAMESIVAAHRGQTVAAICHGGVINAWAAHLVDHAQVFFFEPIYTSVSRFRASSQGHRTIVSLNETAHLRGLPRWESGNSSRGAGEQAP